ncbi:Mur ligase family protein [Rapidithrix thailandica]|uniref:Mur ligase family protein n=1 Tax=Rapidithrix thailandica TaxID=413964 RepID=A0AAW9S8F2_9BACT
MKIHFISIGGSVMHNLAIALQERGNKITGSDDEIFEPSYSRLKAKGLLPEPFGWFPEKITQDIDAVVLGMHAKRDNPELQKAQELGLKIYSFPEYIYQQNQDKQRIVVAGSHGKSTVTSMIVHVMNTVQRPLDYLLGALPVGMDHTIRLTERAPSIVIEGDEYLTSALDLNPKFLHYKHHVVVMTGIAWDHINVFPTLEAYTQQFVRLAEQTPKGGTIIYNSEDKVLSQLVKKANIQEDVTLIPYTSQKHKLKDGQTLLQSENKDLYPVKFFGEHNMLNVSAVKEVCAKMGVSNEDFCKAMQSYQGLHMRMQLLVASGSVNVYRDFAHAPSKLKATVEALKKQFPKRKLRACFELHTYSSLNSEFIQQYKGAMKKADEAMVYFNPHTLELKNMPPISPQQLKDAFNDQNLKVFTNSDELHTYLSTQEWNAANLALMSSGSFNNLDLEKLVGEITA